MRDRGQDGVARRMADWWLRDRHTGRWVVGQFPNAAILVFAVATVLRWSPYDRMDRELALLGSGALIVWGADEVIRGVNPLRRLLGGLVLGWQLAALTLASFYSR